MQEKAVAVGGRWDKSFLVPVGSAEPGKRSTNLDGRAESTRRAGGEAT